MDGFGDNFDQNDVDPAAEFLAREKDQLASLGDDVIAPPNDSAALNSGDYSKYVLYVRAYVKKNTFA